VAAAAVPVLLPLLPVALLPLLLHALSSGNATPPATAAAAPRRNAARLIGTARGGDDSPDLGRSELVIKFTSVSLKKHTKRALWRTLDCPVSTINAADPDNGIVVNVKIQKIIPNGGGFLSHLN